MTEGPKDLMFPSAGRRPALQLTTAACVALLLSACSSTADTASDGRSEPEVSATPTLLKTASLEFPLDAYEATPEDREALARAQGVLTAQCMARYGFTYRAPDESSTSGSVSNSRIFGVVDMETASQYGYKNPRTARPPEIRQQPRLSGAEELALLGDPDLNPDDLPNSQEDAVNRAGSKREVNNAKIPVGGCTRESFLKLYAPKPNSVDVLYVFNLKGRADSEFRADSRVREANKHWSACMAKAGYTASDPQTAVADLGFSDKDRSGPEAITAAKADVSCKKKGNLIGIYVAVLSAYQQQLVEHDAETLHLAKKQLEDRLRLAATLAN